MVCKQHSRSHRNLGIPADFLECLFFALVCVSFEMCVYASVEYTIDAGEALVLLQKLTGLILCLQQVREASCPSVTVWTLPWRYLALDHLAQVVYTANRNKTGGGLKEKGPRLPLFQMMFTDFCFLIRKVTHAFFGGGFFFFWLCRAACGILVPRPGIEPRPPAVEAWSPNLDSMDHQGIPLLIFKMIKI